MKRSRKSLIYEVSIEQNVLITRLRDYLGRRDVLAYRAEVEAHFPLLSPPWAHLFITEDFIPTYDTFDLIRENAERWEHSGRSVIVYVVPAAIYKDIAKWFMDSELSGIQFDRSFHVNEDSAWAWIREWEQRI